MKYDRYLDIHLTAKDGAYDFVGNVNDQRAYVTKKLTMVEDKAVKIINLVSMSADGKSLSQCSTNLEASSLSDTAYVVCALRIDEVKNFEQPPEWFRLAVQWVSARDHYGKIRLNSHGSPGGVLWMGRPREEATAADFAQLLANCALISTVNPLGKPGKGKRREGSGLATICLCCCYAASGGTAENLVLGDAQSAVRQVADWLSKKKVYGVEVTGAEFPVEVFGIGGGDSLTLDVSLTSMNWKQAEGLSKADLIKKIQDLKEEVNEKSTAMAFRSMTHAPEYKELFEKAIDPARANELSKEQLVFLYAECERNVERRRNDIYPMGAKPGQWGVWVRHVPTSKRRIWFRVHDSSNNKYKFRSSETGGYQV